MTECAIRSDATERRRFWLWLVAALVALAFLLGVIKWTARQGIEPHSSGALEPTSAFSHRMQICHGVGWAEGESL